MASDPNQHVLTLLTRSVVFSAGVKGHEQEPNVNLTEVELKLRWMSPELSPDPEFLSEHKPAAPLSCELLDK